MIKDNKYYLQWEQVFERLKPIDRVLNIVYGIPNGGMIASAFLTNARVTHDPATATIFLDDIIDSGHTKEIYAEKYPGIPFYGIIDKSLKDDYIEFSHKWIVFPWEVQHPNTQQTVHENIVRVLQYIGEDPNREGLVGTPDRVVRMYAEIFRGYDKNQRPKVIIFKNGVDGINYNQMIIDEGTFYSHCEHHMVPFFGKYYFAYIPSPKGNIIGLSKVARIIDYHAARLQIQERLVHDIIEDLWEVLTQGEDFVEPPLGMGLVMVGEHLCKTMRGAKKKGTMTTIKLKGVMLDKPDAKAEFLQRCPI